jgi:hypothetical protein
MNLGLDFLGNAALASVGYRPFLDPLPVWDWWYLLIIPLTLLFSLVYKSVRCSDVRRIPREALVISFWILAFMVAAAVGITGLTALAARV